MTLDEIQAVVHRLILEEAQHKARAAKAIADREEAITKHVLERLALPEVELGGTWGVKGGGS